MNRYKASCLTTGLIFLIAFLVACGGGEDVELSPTPPEGNKVVSLGITSTAFTQGEAIPERYAKDGADISPPLQWGAPPDGTKSFVLIVGDPDAKGGTWIHWLLFNLPPDTLGLPENAASGNGLPSGAIQGKNSWGHQRYEGPDPPSGTHHYYFKIYALDRSLALESGIKSKELVKAMAGHVVGYGELMGIYSD